MNKWTWKEVEQCRFFDFIKTLNNVTYEELYHLVEENTLSLVQEFFDDSGEWLGTLYKDNTTTWLYALTEQNWIYYELAD